MRRRPSNPRMQLTYDPVRPLAAPSTCQFQMTADPYCQAEPRSAICSVYS